MIPLDCINNANKIELRENDIVIVQNIASKTVFVYVADVLDFQFTPAHLFSHAELQNIIEIYNIDREAAKKVICCG